MRAKIKYFLLSLLVMISVAFTGCSIVVETEEGLEDTAVIVETEGEDSEADDVGSGDKTDEQDDAAAQGDDKDAASEAGVSEDGGYTSKEEVAEYLYIYGHLPSNFITKKEAKALGWVSSEGNLGEVAPGKSIGGDYFGNYEGVLPEGKDYHECDIDSDGGYRGAKRIVYSDDGCIYYTEDHYETFELLYGEE